jgi:hypothetical protein
MKDGNDEVAAAVLDSSTLVMGTPVIMAKQAIDARDKKGDNATKDAALFGAFKATDQAGVLRFALKFPKDRIPAEQAAKDPTLKTVSAINYIAGALNATSGLGLTLTAKTGSPTDAQPLRDTLQQWLDMGKKQTAGSEQMKSLATILNTITITMDGSDVNLAMTIPPDQLTSLATDLGKMGSAFGGAMGGSSGGPTSPGPNTNSSSSPPNLDHK